MVSRTDPVRRLSYRDRMLGLRVKLREAYNMAHRADVEWNALNDAHNQRHKEINDRRRQARRPLLTPSEMREMKAENHALTDAFGMQSWWRDQASFLAQMILAEQAVHQAEEEL